MNANLSIPAEASTLGPPRPEVRGKFLYVDARKFFVKGVTYGTFEKNLRTGDFPTQDRVDADFRAMAANGINSVRVYIVPPRWLLDIARMHGLRVLIGMPWEQHIAFLNDRGTEKRICDRLRSELSEIVGHPAILAYAIGNEIPATVVRWHGAKKIEHFLGRLAGVVRSVDQYALLTYVNFPTTEYLDLTFVDFVSFNVYLEDNDRLTAYLARLQNLAGEKPLLMAEIGLDSMRNGTQMQASTLSAQIETVFEAGAIGTFVFAWTDEWYRSGAEITDWDFGLVTRDRIPKPALPAVRQTFAQLPLRERSWPKMSVVVCSYNGSRLIGETLDHLMRVDYPDYEVIVVNDGSTDDTGKIAAQFDVTLIEQENMGLSAARNVGMDAATGEYIVYTDDDAYPDPHWLKFLALMFENGHAACGGPNIAPPEDPDLAECVANAPGGPVQVLLDDELAEHVPGCNMAFRADALRAIGGFDPQFRTAGDDVDACWRIMDNGGTIGFAHTAVVWHHRRASLKTYFKQQRGYARAESLVARKWPQKYNGSGHMVWHGRLYGRGLMQSLTERQRIYQGTWGQAPFQSVYRQADGVMTSLPLMPEWYFITGLLLAIGALGFDWAPLLAVLALGVVAFGISLAMAWRGARKARFNVVAATPKRASSFKLRAIVFWLYLLQPLMRLIGRIRYRLGPWSSGRIRLLPLPLGSEMAVWSPQWHAPEAVLMTIQERLLANGANTAPGSDFDDWDLATGLSIFGELRVKLMVEEHGHGQQYFRAGTSQILFTPTILILLLLYALSAGAFLSGAVIAGSVLAALSLGLLLSTWSALSSATAAWRDHGRPVLTALEKGSPADQPHDVAG
ncbi:glycosyltransferase [Croceicoccus sp. Ery15]|uniref:glycosyltransferase n=1 Tax=Croceicoccus sp. Ery15 TaxID=1703338 RepID=UPI001E39FD19|nr:glycosyltransferase [Croceicoccus sp. Ery15]